MTEQAGNETPVVDQSPGVLLNETVRLIKSFMGVSGLGVPVMRNNVMDRMLLPLIASHTSVAPDLVLFAVTEEDTGYVALLREWVPTLSARLNEDIPQATAETRSLLVSALPIAAGAAVWSWVGVKVATAGVTPESFKAAVSARGLQVRLGAVPGVSYDVAISQVMEELPFGDALLGVQALSSAVDVAAALEDILKEARALDGQDPSSLEAAPGQDSDLDVDSDTEDGVPSEGSAGEEETEDEDEEEDDPIIYSYTQRVMDVYKDLFEVGFELKRPYGILTRRGVLRIAKGKSKLSESAVYAPLYDLLNASGGGVLVEGGQLHDVPASELRDLKLQSDATYYPAFHLGNLFGVMGERRVDTWDELEPLLYKEVYNNIKKNHEAGRDAAWIANTLTNCIVITDYSPKSGIQLRMNIGNRTMNKEVIKRSYAQQRTEIFAGNGALYHIDQLKTGVIELSLVFNLAAFTGKPLFAYEAVEVQLNRGRKPSLSNMVLGQNTSGKILTMNMDRQNAAVVLIGAGARSGKGVLTLNLLGTVLSQGSPLIYLDGKPDMAVVLRDLGRKNGVNPAVWDGMTSFGRPTGAGAPDVVSMENPGLFGVLMYYKVVQLMIAAATLQANGVTIGNGNRPFFVFDEALAMQMTAEAVWKQIVTLGKDKSGGEESAWAKHIMNWCSNLASSLNSALVSQLPKSGISTVWLFQSMQRTVWSASDLEAPSGKFNVLATPTKSTSAIKFLGKGTADTEYGLSNVKNDRIIASRVMDDGGRHFALTTNQKPTSMEEITVFKPYLVLNESEAGASSVEEMRKNVSPEVWNVISDANGNLHPGAGFEGFAKLLGDEAVTNLGLGRAYLEELMLKLGLQYDSVEDYIYDASIESFKSVGELIRGGGSSSGSDGSGDYEADKYGENEDFEPYEQEAVPESVEGVPGEEPVVVRSQDEYQRFQEPSGSPLDWGAGAPVVTEDPFTGSGSAPESDVYEEDDEPEVPPGMEDDEDDRVVSAPRVDPTVPTYESSPLGGYQPPAASQSRPAAPPVEERMRQDRVESPNEQMGYSNVYSKPVDLDRDAFASHQRARGTFSSLQAIRDTSKMLMDEIGQAFGDLSRITAMEITNTGIVLNGVAFRPRFSQESIAAMPYDIQAQVARGNIVELFSFANIYKFRNLGVLIVDSARLAEGRLRRELGIAPNRPWSVLLKKMPSLTTLEIAGERITDEGSARRYEDNGRGGVTFTEQIRKGLGVGERILQPSRMSGLLSKAWQTRPVRIVGRAAGWTAAGYVVATAASALGLWGGVLAVSSAIFGINEVRKRRGAPRADRSFDQDNE